MYRAGGNFFAIHQFLVQKIKVRKKILARDLTYSVIQNNTGFVTVLHEDVLVDESHLMVLMVLNKFIKSG